jgi:hypothetical protein
MFETLICFDRGQVVSSNERIVTDSPAHTCNCSRCVWAAIRNCVTKAWLRQAHPCSSKSEGCKLSTCAGYRKDIETRV